MIFYLISFKFCYDPNDAISLSVIYRHSPGASDGSSVISPNDTRQRDVTRFETDANIRLI